MNKMGDKELLKIKCPRKMSFRQEEWLNDMLQKGNGFFLFESENNGPKIDVSLHTKAIKMKEDVLRGKVQAALLTICPATILANGNIKTFFFVLLFYAVLIGPTLGPLWNYYKECRRVIKAAKMIE